LHPNIIQTNAYSLDAQASLQSLAAWDETSARDAELQFLKEYKIQAIISDAVALACSLANILAVPSILVTNFTFDSIFMGLLATPSQQLDDSLLRLKIKAMSEAYATATLIMRLPGSIPFLFDHRSVVDVPMHFRKARTSREHMLATLGLKSWTESKILLHCFGGHPVTSMKAIPELPAGWKCLSQSIHAPPHFHRFPNNVYMPDLIAGSDVVLGKLGWGTCSEVIGNGDKPFIYVPREEFVEEQGLREWMQQDHGRLVRLEIEKYESFLWTEAIVQASESQQQQDQDQILYDFQQAKEVLRKNFWKGLNCIRESM